MNQDNEHKESTVDVIKLQLHSVYKAISDYKVWPTDARQESFYEIQTELAVTFMLFCTTLRYILSWPVMQCLKIGVLIKQKLY